MISKDGGKAKAVNSERRTIVAEVGVLNASSATSPKPFIPQVYQDDEDCGHYVVIVTELPDNEGTLVTNAIENIARQVASTIKASSIFWIEHYPAAKRRFNRREETFDQVFFLTQRLGESPLFLHPQWRRMDWAEVERLIGTTPVSYGERREVIPITDEAEKVETQSPETEQAEPAATETAGETEDAEE